MLPSRKHLRRRARPIDNVSQRRAPRTVSRIRRRARAGDYTRGVTDMYPITSTRWLLRCSELRRQATHRSRATQPTTTFGFPRLDPAEEAIVVILGKNVPYHQYEREISLRFILFVLHVVALSQREKYRLVYVHRQDSGVSGPGLLWLLRSFRRMPRRARRLLSCLVVVNAGLQLHLSRWTILPFIDFRVWRRLRFGGVLDDLRLEDHPHIMPLLQFPKRKQRERIFSFKSLSPRSLDTRRSPEAEAEVELEANHRVSAPDGNAAIQPSSELSALPEASHPSGTTAIASAA